MPKWLPLMRTGSFKDRFGKVYNVTADALKRIAANYNPVLPAQLVVGHPGKSTVPSFGIVDKLKAAGDRLLFQPGNVVAEFAALVKKGGFPDVSAGLDAGLTQLRHVAFLSAERPAIDGLEPICEFSAPADSNSVDLMVSSVFDRAEFSVDENWFLWKFRDIARALRGLRENIVEKDGVESADRILPGYLVDSLNDDPPITTENSFPISEFSHEGGSVDYQKLYELEQTKTADLTTKVAEFSAKLENVTNEKTALAAKVEATETAAAKAEFSAFVEKLISDKKVLPAEKDALVANLMKLRSASGAEFSSSDAESPLSLFKAELEKRAATVPGSNHTADSRGAEFSAASGVDDLVTRATAYKMKRAAEGVPVSSADAIRYVSGK